MNVEQLKSKFQTHSQYDKICDLIDNAIQHIDYEHEAELSDEFVQGVTEYVKELNNFKSDLLI